MLQFGFCCIPTTITTTMVLVTLFICPLGTALYLMCTSFFSNLNLQGLECSNILAQKWEGLLPANSSNFSLTSTVPLNVDTINCCLVELQFLEKNCLRIFLDPKLLEGNYLFILLLVTFLNHCLLGT